ncbi:MAG: (2Fe-2S)-binding protein [Pseudomonadota bacterium]|nr:(2Fe-2S)-binding protein [Pseudomonadota bacterium]
MQLNINGQTREVNADADTPLLWVLREELGMTGTKYGCGVAQCGACTVMVAGEPMRSCVMPASAVVGQPITTIEAVEADPVGKRVVAAWVAQQVPQCGYCQSGQVMAATALLKAHPQPTEQQISDAMTNLCRCGTYNAASAAIRQAAAA